MSVIEKAKELEHFVTDQWAADAILEKEILTGTLLDPCVGTGLLMHSYMKKKGSICGSVCLDIYDWGYCSTDHICDFLELERDSYELERLFNRLFAEDFTVFMNPPFSKACEFVEKSFELGAREIVCFQRFAWWESNNRKDFWDRYPPNRVYVCGDRASCYLYGLDKDDKGRHLHPETGKPMAGTTTAHAWIVWERGAPARTILDRIYREVS